MGLIQIFGGAKYFVPQLSSTILAPSVFGSGCERLLCCERLL